MKTFLCALLVLFAIGCSSAPQVTDSGVPVSTARQWCEDYAYPHPFRFEAPDTCSLEVNSGEWLDMDTDQIGFLTSCTERTQYICNYWQAKGY